MKTEPEINKFYSPEQIATMLGVTPYTVRSWIKRGIIKAIKLPNRRWRISQSSLEQFMGEQ